MDSNGCYEVLQVLGYRKLDGSYGDRKEARESGVKYPPKFAIARCGCGVEKTLKISGAGGLKGRKCPTCAQSFKRNPQLYCDCGTPTHRQNTVCRKCARRRYSDREEEYMCHLSQYPHSVAVEKFQQFCRAYGFPKRKAKAISSKFFHLGIQFKGLEESHWTRQKFCTLLGLPKHRGYCFERIGVPFKTAYNKQKRLSSVEFRKWLESNDNKAKFFPYIENCDLDGCEFVLGKKLFETYLDWDEYGLIKPIPNRPKPLKVNSVRYPSVSAAAKAVFVSEHSLRMAANGVSKNCCIKEVEWA